MKKRKTPAKFKSPVIAPAPAPTSGPINMAVPNITGQKMEAIISLSHAVKSLATALDGVHLDVVISNNVIVGATGNGISINSPE